MARAAGRGVARVAACADCGELHPGGLQRGDDLVGVRRRTHRRRRDIHAVGHGQGVDEVAVRIDEARHQQLAAQVLDHRLGTLALHHVGVSPDSDDLSILDGNRFGIGGRIAHHRQDRPAVEDQVRSCAGRSSLLRAAGQREHGCQSDPHLAINSLHDLVPWFRMPDSRLPAAGFIGFPATLG